MMRKMVHVKVTQNHNSYSPEPCIFIAAALALDMLLGKFRIQTYSKEKRPCGINSVPKIRLASDRNRQPNQHGHRSP
jgi:hypothetical protein